MATPDCREEIFYQKVTFSMEQTSTLKKTIVL